MHHTSADSAEGDSPSGDGLDGRERRLLERLFHLRRVLLRPKVDQEVQTEVSFTRLLLEAGVSEEAIRVMKLEDNS